MEHGITPRMLLLIPRHVFMPAGFIEKPVYLHTVSVTTNQGPPKCALTDEIRFYHRPQSDAGTLGDRCTSTRD